MRIVREIFERGPERALSEQRFPDPMRDLHWFGCRVDDHSGQAAKGSEIEGLGGAGGGARGSSAFLTTTSVATAERPLALVRAARPGLLCSTRKRATAWGTLPNSSRPSRGMYLVTRHAFY